MEGAAPRVPEGAPESQQLFDAADYAVFGAMLALCAAIGLYFALAGRPRKDDGARTEGDGEGEGEASTADDYLMGGRRMRTLPVSMSLIASYVSGITLLGTPTEVYLYGIQYVYICISAVLMGLVLSEMYLPTFHRLGITSTYEYLEMRFSKSARIFGSFLFFIGTIIWLPIVMYVAALAFNQVTGVSVHIVSPLVCLVCIFYTCVGGLKAVVWTDVVQTIAMFGSLLLVIIKGTADVGGVGVVWERARDSGRIEKPNLSIDPLERHTLLVLIVGGLFHWLQSSGVSQMMMQRYLCLPTLGKSKLAVWVFVLGAVFLVVLCTYAGLLIYATYYDCDPLTTQLAKRNDQLLPLLMMRTIGHLPGLSGCFIAGVFSAALSSMSTSLNSMSAVVLEDFYKTFFKKPLTGRQTSILMKSVVVITGIICVCLVVVVEKLGSILQMALSLVSITNGPTLGLFSMGLFFPWINTLGVITGGTVGLLFIGWVIIGTQTAIAAGTISFDKMPLSVDGCTYNYSLPITNDTLLQGYSDETTSDVFGLYRISYLWYTLVGCLVSILVGLLVSFISGANDPQKVDPRLLSPCVAWIFAEDKEKEKELTVQPVTENETPQDYRLTSGGVNPHKTTCMSAPDLSLQRREKLRRLQR